MTRLRGGLTIDPSMCSVGASPLLHGLVDLDVGDEHVLCVQTLGLQNDHYSALSEQTSQVLRTA